MSDWSPEYNTDYAHLASGTFSGYITGTVKLVAIVWFIFMLLSVLTSMLMGYARYMARPSRTTGFFNPPLRQFKQTNNEVLRSSGQSTVL